MNHYPIINALNEGNKELVRLVLFAIDDPIDLGNALRSSPIFFRSMNKDDSWLLKSNLLTEKTEVLGQDHEMVSGFLAGEVRFVSFHCFVDPQGKRYGVCTKKVAEIYEDEEGNTEIGEWELAKTCEYKFGKKHGHEIKVTGDNFRVVSEYKKGIEIKRDFTENGKVYRKCSFKDGYQEGPTECYYPDGTLRSVTMYKKSFPCGKYKEWYSNGQLRETYFYDDDGEIMGEHIVYSDTGNILSRRYKEYKERIEYDMNGDIIKD